MKLRGTCSRRKVREVRETEDAQAERRIELVVAVMLDERAGLEQVAAARLREVVLPAHDVLAQPQVRRALRAEARHAADVDRAHAVAAGHEHRQRLARVGFDVLADARAAVAEARGVHGLADSA